MRTKILLATAFSILIITCCENPTSPTNYELSDLVGDWSGKATNSNSTLTLDLTVDSEGNVSGSNFGSKWNISSDGKVTGEGGCSIQVGNAIFRGVPTTWSLQLNSKKKKLTGQLYLDFIDLELDVNLTK